MSDTTITIDDHGVARGPNLCDACEHRCASRKRASTASLDTAPRYECKQHEGYGREVGQRAACDDFTPRVVSEAEHAFAAFIALAKESVDKEKIAAAGKHAEALRAAEPEEFPPPEPTGWAKSLLTSSSACKLAPRMTVIIQARDEFETLAITFSGSADGARLHQIVCDQKTVWTAEDLERGIPVPRDGGLALRVRIPRGRYLDVQLSGPEGGACVVKVMGHKRLARGQS